MLSLEVELRESGLEVWVLGASWEAVPGRAAAKTKQAPDDKSDERQEHKATLCSFSGICYIT